MKKTGNLIYYTLESINKARNFIKDAKREREKRDITTQASCSLSIAIKSGNVKGDKEAEKPPKTTKERARESDKKKTKGETKRKERKTNEHTRHLPTG